MSALAGHTVLVVGLGSSGFATARALLGMDVKVRVTESGNSAAIAERAETLGRAGAEVETGGHDLSLIHADLAVVSPGIPPAAPVVGAIRAANIEMLSDVELAARVSTCSFIAVTGTNGKTTTTSLIAHILEEAGIPSVAAGNIGLPVLEAIHDFPSEGIVALEASSFQLEGTRTFKPRVAVVLNIAEDHTDWHGTVDAYAAAKARIVANQTGEDFYIPNYDDARAMQIARSTSASVVPFSSRELPDGGIGVEEGSVVWAGEPLVEIEELSLRGPAGLDDSLAAAGATLSLGIDAGAVTRALRSFRPLAHRAELVARIGEVDFIDDSKATNPHATRTAVAGLTDVVLIAGGRSKGMDLTPLGTTVPPVKHVVAIGEAAGDIARVFEGIVGVSRAATMGDAVREAFARSHGRGSVLLSPGCASLDMYESYAARGEDFARSVAELRNERRGSG